MLCYLGSLFCGFISISSKTLWSEQFHNYPYSKLIMVDNKMVFRIALLCGAGSWSQLIFGIALLSWLPPMLWWCETRTNHFDPAFCSIKAQKQQDVVANIAISSQIPLTHQVNTYVLVVALVGMCGQAFHMGILYGLRASAAGFSNAKL